MAGLSVEWLRISCGALAQAVRLLQAIAQDGSSAPCRWRSSAGGPKTMPFRRLEARQLGAHVVGQLGAGGSNRVLAAATNATGTSPHFSSGGATTAASSTAGWRRERLLDLDRRDVLAAGNDDVLGAVAQLDVEVRMHHAEVAGAGTSPSGQAFCGGCFVVGSSPASGCCRASRSRPSSARRPARRRPGRRRREPRTRSTLPTPWRDLSRACSGMLERRPVRCATRRPTHGP